LVSTASLSAPRYEHTRSSRVISICCGVFVWLFGLVSRLKRIHEPLGKVELKYGASRLVCVSPQPAPLGVDDGPADRQAHPHSTGLGGVKSLENALDMFRSNARPRIAHHDEDSICPLCSVLISNSRCETFLINRATSRL
jgi:hypothetical protein